MTLLKLPFTFNPGIENLVFEKLRAPKKGVYVYNTVLLQGGGWGGSMPTPYPAPMNTTREAASTNVNLYPIVDSINNNRHLHLHDYSFHVPYLYVVV
jgi:hypothetical protein